MVEALSNPDQKRISPDYIDQLQAFIRRSPRSAAEVRTAMETQHGAEGASLYELLWRYNHHRRKATSMPSPPTPSGWSAAWNIKDLDFRVLAFWNLKNLSKAGLNYNYKPDDPPPKRQMAAQKWRDHFRQLAPANRRKKRTVAPLPPDEHRKPASRAGE